VHNCCHTVIQGSTQGHSSGIDAQGSTFLEGKHLQRSTISAHLLSTNSVILSAASFMFGDLPPFTETFSLAKPIQDNLFGERRAE
jgi:hypothetical protein